VDVDSDGEEDLLWVLSNYRSSHRTVAFTFRDGRIRPVEKVPIPGTLTRIEFDSSGKAAGLVYSEELGEGWDECRDPAIEMESDAVVRSPELLAEVVHGKLHMDSRAVREALRWCPAPPPTRFRRAVEVLCARLWGQPTEELLDDIERRFRQGSCAELGSDPDHGATTEYHPMRTAAEWRPPLRLDQPLEPGLLDEYRKRVQVAVETPEKKVWVHPVYLFRNWTGSDWGPFNLAPNIGRGSYEMLKKNVK
jgi:hypothetical protein